MQISTPQSRRGSILVFVLMGLIAILALGVVFLSRAGRDNPEPYTPGNAPTASAPFEAPIEEVESATAATDSTATVNTVTPVPVVVPPPPPPINTPDTRDLPPEG